MQENVEQMTAADWSLFAVIAAVLFSAALLATTLGRLIGRIRWRKPTWRFTLPWRERGMSKTTARQRFIYKMMEGVFAEGLENLAYLGLINEKEYRQERERLSHMYQIMDCSPADLTDLKIKLKEKRTGKKLGKERLEAAIAARKAATA